MFLKLLKLILSTSLCDMYFPRIDGEIDLQIKLFFPQTNYSSFNFFKNFNNFYLTSYVYNFFSNLDKI